VSTTTTGADASSLEFVFELLLSVPDDSPPVAEDWEAEAVEAAVAAVAADVP